MLDARAPALRPRPVSRPAPGAARTREPRAPGAAFAVLHAGLPLAAGVAIYLLWRSTDLRVFGWLAAAGLDGAVLRLREHAAPLGAALPGWLLYSAPDGLWIYSAASCTIWLWGDRRSPARLACIAAAPAMGIGWELGQLAGLLPGTYDPADLLGSTVAAAAALALGARVAGADDATPSRRRELGSAVALLGFVLLLTGTSKPSSSGAAPTPPWATTGAGLGGSPGEDADEEAAGATGPEGPEVEPETTSSPGGMTPSRDAGPPPPAAAPAGSVPLPPPWSAMGLPIADGEIDALRVIHRRATVPAIELRYVGALRARGWSVARAIEGEPSGGKTVELTRSGASLVLRFGRKDGDVSVSINRL